MTGAADVQIALMTSYAARAESTAEGDAFETEE